MRYYFPDGSFEDYFDQDDQDEFILRIVKRYCGNEIHSLVMGLMEERYDLKHELDLSDADIAYLSKEITRLSN